MSIIVENLINLRRSEIILNEAFVVKSYTLLEIEKEFNKMRSEKLDFYSNISQHPSIININRLFEKQFGIHLFALKVDPSKEHNAYTMVIAANFDVAHYVDLPNMITGTVNEGFRWKEGNGLCIIVNISYGLLSDPEITDSELVAIILHEIGHNFADALYGEINIANKRQMIEYEKYLSGYATVIGFLLALPAYIKAKRLLKEYNNSTRVERESKPKKTSKIRGILNGIKGKWDDYCSYKQELLARKRGGKVYRDYKRKLGSTAKVKARESLARQNEVIADKFAAIYGYGAEIASGLTKLTYHKSEAAKKLEAAGGRLAEASRDFDDAVKDICDYDCHPHLVQRINEEIKLLEREVAKEDIDPRYKIVIYDQISQLKILLDKITKTSKVLSKDENAKNAYHDYVNKTCPSAVSDEIEDKIEEALDKLIEEDKKKNKKK